MDEKRIIDPDATIQLAMPVPRDGRNMPSVLPAPEELTALLPPGNFSVEGFIGEGGMGAVYKGTQIRLHRSVAIKIMRREQDKDHAFEERFHREALAMAQLSHPNIVNVIDCGEAGPDFLYIVMEFVDGTDLMEFIRSGQMTQAQAVKLLPQICDALQFAHDHGIVHRDIKPSNILLTRDGRIKVADFGLAKLFDAESNFHTRTGTGVGTPAYAAPEQFELNAKIDHRADIYALGVMTYQMITGHLPRGVWRLPSHRAAVDPQWDDLISHAMQIEPKDRFASVSEVKAKIGGIVLKQGNASGQLIPRSKVPYRFVIFGSLTVLFLVGVFFWTKDSVATSSAAPVVAKSSAQTWHDALTEFPLKKVISTLVRTPQGYVLPADNHWTFPATPLNAGMLRWRGEARGGWPELMILCLDHSKVMTGSSKPDQHPCLMHKDDSGIRTLVQGDSTHSMGEMTAVPGEMVLLRLGGRLRLIIDGVMVLDVADPTTGQVQFGLNKFSGADYATQAVDYLPLDDITAAAALELVSVKTAGQSSR